MTLPAPRTPQRSPRGAIANVVLIVGTIVVAATIVIVTGSTGGFADLVAVLIALAMFDDARRRRHRR